MPQREEESLIDDMRAAIRGDRERAAARAEREHEPPALLEPTAPVAQPEPAPEAAKGRFRRLLGR
ncbi:MAG TPA: hypothetical protein VIU16_10945, partial [Gaiellaceae bacterium]